MIDEPIVRAARMTDLVRVVDLLNKGSRQFTGEADVSETELKAEWTEPGCNPEQDMLVAEMADGRIVAFAEYSNTREPHVRPFGYCSVDPDIQDSWDWSELITWALDRAENDVEKSPADLKVTFLAWVELNNEKVMQSWKDAGLVETRRFYQMKIDFDGPPQPAAVPNGYDIRAMRPEEHRRVYDALMEAFVDHYGFVKPPDPEIGYRRWSHYFIGSDEFDADLMLIAVSQSGEIAGGNLSKGSHAEDTDMGWVNSLAVGREHRNKGVGEALLRRSFEVMFGKGKKRAGLGVDADSLTDATRLYKKCGMHTYQVFAQVSKVLRDGKEVANVGEPHP